MNVPNLSSPRSVAGERSFRWRRMPIRWRLTFWYGGSLCLLLIGFSTLVWAMTNAWLLAQTDAELVEELAEMRDSIDASNDEAELRQNVNGWSRLHEPYGYEYEIHSRHDGLPMKSRRLAQANATLTASGATSATVHSWDCPQVGRLRVKTIETVVFGQPRQLWIAVSQVEQQQLLRQLLIVQLAAGLVIMIGAGGGGYFLSRRVLRPIDDITETARTISASNLDSRIEVENPHDELGRLAQTLNTMLDRLDQSFAELKRFSADASHELRTPLTLLRTELEVCLRKSRPASDYQETLRRALDDTQRMCRLAEQLLELARSDSDSRPVASDPIPLAALLTDIVSQLDSRAGPKDISIELDEKLFCTTSGDESDETVLAEGVAMSGDCARIHRLFFNLLDNAVKYTSAGGRVQIHANKSNNAVRVTIEDSGCGIPPEHLPHIFDRFYRVDSSRTATTGGTGLGLAICKSIAEAHDGTIDITSAPGRGTQVTVSLPLLYGATLQ